MGQNFSWIESVGHGIDRQRVRRQRAENLWDEVGRNSVENECTCFCKPIKGWSKTTKIYLCLLIYKNCTYLWQILDWYWARNLFEYRLPVSKRLTTLLRHGQLPREENGAIELWRLKDYLRNDFMHYRHWSDEMWRQQEKSSILYSLVWTKNSISELFEVIQDAIPLILPNRTMC